MFHISSKLNEESFFSPGVSYFYVLSEVFVPFIPTWHEFQLPYWYESATILEQPVVSGSVDWVN